MSEVTPEEFRRFVLENREIIEGILSEGSGDAHADPAPEQSRSVSMVDFMLLAPLAVAYGAMTGLGAAYRVISASGKPSADKSAAAEPAPAEPAAPPEEAPAPKKRSSKKGGSKKKS